MSDSISKALFMEFLRDPNQDLALNNEQYHALIRVLIAAQLQGNIAYRVVDDTAYPVYFQRHLRSIKTFSTAQYAQVLLACKTIAKDLAEANTPIILLKGAAYIAAKKQNAKGRLISDVDILVAKEHLPMLEKLLTSKGWVAKEMDDYDEKYYREWSHELPPYSHLETGVTLDIHHNLIPGSAGKSINIDHIIETSQMTEVELSVPDDQYLILHSAIHLLLNDDVDKGLRDCLDLHSLLLAYAVNHSMGDLKELFTSVNCEKEYFILLLLLKKLFANASLTYTKHIDENVVDKTLIARAEDFAKAVFPSSQYLQDSSNSLVRFKVYVNGHLSKMPISLFIKHILYKSYRMTVKKLLGEFIFKKPHSEN